MKKSLSLVAPSARRTPSAARVRDPYDVAAVELLAANMPSVLDRLGTMESATAAARRYEVAISQASVGTV